MLNGSVFDEIFVPLPWRQQTDFQVSLNRRQKIIFPSRHKSLRIEMCGETETSRGLGSKKLCDPGLRCEVAVSLLPSAIFGTGGPRCPGDRNDPVTEFNLSRRV